METMTSDVLTREQLLTHWQGHRNLTRRTIEAFPEKELFEHSIGNMRPFAQLIMELLNIAVYGIDGVVTRKWETKTDFSSGKAKTKADLLKAWDETTDYLNTQWEKIPEGRFQEKDVAFGQFEGIIYWHIFYFIDNEIHHRGQGYVFLRSLGIQPPFFWER